MHRFLILGLALCWPLFATAQSTNSTLARMNQDMILLNEQLGQVRAQVEEMQRQQAQMMKNYQDLLKQQQAMTQSLNAFVAQTETKLEALPEREAKLKAEIGEEMNKQIEALTKQIQKTIDALSQAQQKPNVAPQVNFTEDYPETGFSHIVKPGETISGIAREYGSTTRDIINANRIANARGLRAGETIFVPVATD